MNRMILVVLAASALLIGGGFAAGMVLGARNPTQQLAEARKSIDELEADLSKGRDCVNDLKRQLEDAKADAADHARKLTKALKRIAGLERERTAEERTATAKPVPGETNVAERVITLNGKDGENIDILDSLKNQLSNEEFSHVTNAMTQLRARLAEKAKGRMEYLASINTDGMSDDERANHAKFLKLMERREAIAAKMKGGLPDMTSIQEMVQLEMEMAPVAKKARSALIGQVARELGYQGDDVEVVRDTVNMIYDCTSGGGMGGLGDIMDSAGGAPGTPGMVISPDVKVETHVIGL